MSEQPRRGIRPGTTPARRRVGEPNVLSNQAIPNRLSTMPQPGTSSAPPVSARPANAIGRPANAIGRPGPVPTADQAPRTRRLPSLSTLLFVGFLIFTAARFLNNMAAGDGSPTTPPAPPTAPGTVTFGTELGDGCDLTNVAGRFPLSADVWWRAQLGSVQAEDVTVVVRAYRDEGQIEREEIPPEDGTGDWEILCAGEPVNGYQAGSYRLEVWDELEQALLAVGTYEKQPPTQ